VLSSRSIHAEMRLGEGNLRPNGGLDPVRWPPFYDAAMNYIKKRVVVRL
jgi:hypothetical protein